MKIVLRTVIVFALFIFSIATVSATAPALCSEGQVATSLVWVDKFTTKTWRCATPKAIDTYSYGGHEADSLQLNTDITYWISNGGAYSIDPTYANSATWELVLTDGLSGGQSTRASSWNAPGLGAPISVQWSDIDMSDAGLRSVYELEFEMGSLCGSMYTDYHSTQLRPCYSAEFDSSTNPDCLIHGLVVEDGKLFASFDKLGQPGRSLIADISSHVGEIVTLPYQVDVDGVRMFTWNDWVAVFTIPRNGDMTLYYPCTQPS